MTKELFVKKLLETEKDFLLVFDNGGGLAMQIGEYKHHYSNMGQAVQDLITAVEDNFDFEGWEGNEEDLVVEEDFEIERNGGIKVMSRDDLVKALGEEDFGWCNVEEFVETLSEKLEDMSILFEKLKDLNFTEGAKLIMESYPDADERVNKFDVNACDFDFYITEEDYFHYTTTFVEVEDDVDDVDLEIGYWGLMLNDEHYTHVK